MLEQICAFIHNWFVANRYTGRFVISDGTISLPFLLEGQYFRICGSRLNDGIYQYPVSDLFDETFDGIIWEMRVPRAVLTLASEIEAWQEKYGDAASSPYQSESFGGYSYSKASGRTGNGGGSDTPTWQSVFGSQLSQWRKLNNTLPQITKVASTPVVVTAGVTRQEMQQAISDAISERALETSEET